MPILTKVCKQHRDAFLRTFDRLRTLHPLVTIDRDFLVEVLRGLEWPEPGDGSHYVPLFDELNPLEIEPFFVHVGIAIDDPDVRDILGADIPVLTLSFLDLTRSGDLEAPVLPLELVVFEEGRELLFIGERLCFDSEDACHRFERYAVLDEVYRYLSVYRRPALVRIVQELLLNFQAPPGTQTSDHVRQVLREIGMFVPGSSA